MTDLLTTDDADSGEIPAVGEGTRDLTALADLIRRPSPFRRPDATGEQPIYKPGGTVTIGGQQIRLAETETLVGIAELARLAAGETLVLPLDAPPSVPRDAVPAVYPPAPAEPEERPDDYRARHRAAVVLPPWMVAVLGFAAGALGGVTVLTAAVIQAGGLR